MSKLETSKKLQQIPNIGPAMAEDLIRLGITDVKDLKKQNAQVLYDRISAMDKKKHDICVLDVFEAAIQYAKDGKPRPWWVYSRKRKAKTAKLTPRSKSAGRSS